MKKIILYFKEELLSLSIFIVVISFSQSLILKPHLEFGFSPDDVRLISDYIALGPNPFTQFGKVWINYGGPHMVNPLYYNGVLFTFLGFDYQAYQVAALIFKIISIISFYLLIQLIFKNRLLSFLSGLIFSFHYASIGSLEMVARSQDYLVITGLNIFLIFFYLIFFERVKSIFWPILASFVLFSAFFINPIRAYPFLPYIGFLGAVFLLNNRSWSNFYKISKLLLIFFLPFFLFLVFKGTGGSFYGHAMTIIQKGSVGNLQMLLAPFSSFGSLFLQADAIKFLSTPSWNLEDFPSYFIGGPLIIFGIITFVLSIVLSKKPLKFFLGVFIINFILELLIFLAINTGRNLPDNIRMTYDPYTFTPAAILGVYIFSLTLFTFLEWLSDKQNKLLILNMLGFVFAVTFVWLTWIVYSDVHIPMGIYGYSTIPSMGISASIASILVLAYTRISGGKGLLKSFASSIFLILIPYFFFSNYQIQKYLNDNMAYGNKASDQVYLKNKFWQFLKDDSSPCNNFFFLETTSNEVGGFNYSFIMIDRFDRWYSLYGPFNSQRPCPVALLVSDEEKLSSSYTTSGGEKGSFYKDFNGTDKFFSIENFYAFKLQNRDIFDIKKEILEKLNSK